MKPMLKNTFFATVKELAAAGRKPYFYTICGGKTGLLAWDVDGMKHVEEVFSTTYESAPRMIDRFNAWFVAAMGEFHAAAAEGLEEGDRVLDGDTVRTVTGFRTVAPRDSLGNKTNGICPRTGVIVLDGKIETMAGDVKPYALSDMGDAVKAINAQFNKENGEALDALHHMLHNAMDRMEMDDMHAEALEVNELLSYGQDIPIYMPHLIIKRENGRYAKDICKLEPGTTLNPLAASFFEIGLPGQSERHVRSTMKQFMRPGDNIISIADAIKETMTFALGANWLEIVRSWRAGE